LGQENPRSETATSRDQRPPRSGPSRRVIVGIGASAGALEPLQQFLSHVAADSGLTFVVIQHLERHQPSVLTELLGKHTRMSVEQAVDGTRPRPNHVYVIPPNATLTLDRNLLRVTTPSDTGPRSPIDLFFRSLAVARGEAAVGIILSGTGTDGTSGLRAIRECGGLTLAQAPETAKYEGMPASAIDAGLVDDVLSVEEMPTRLEAYRRQLERARRRESDRVDADVDEHLQRICEVLLRRTGHDFGLYKTGTLIRRIARRVRIRDAGSAADYIQHLERDAGEAEALVRDLSIGVTHFFRDAEAFESLAGLCLPAILDGGDPATPVRIWVPGCASGEEAYSIAMLVLEYLSVRQLTRSVQIFATDIDGELVAAARQGRYSDDILEHVSPERLARFFVREDGTLRVVKELRDACTFSEHSLIRDPPFSSLDLISCRNVLIYLGIDLQAKLVPLFHFALRPGGFLLLGPSEDLAAHGTLFRRIERHHRLFRRNDVVTRPTELPLAVSAPPLWRSPLLAARSASPVQPPVLSQALERMIREDYAPPCVVIDERGEILYLSGRTSRYLQAREGAPTNNIFDQAQTGLRLELRTTLARAAKTGRSAVCWQVAIEPVEADASVRHLRLTVRPLPGVPIDAGLFAVVLQEESVLATDIGGEGPGEASAWPDRDHSIIEQLEGELRTTRIDLRTSAEELETSNEELKSANEELISANEELQSANEELQSSQEELRTVNEELRQKVEALDSARSDLQNHYASSRIATVFLDRALRITRFTPAATALFRLIDADIGRPITDLAPRVRHDRLIADAEEALRTERGVERKLSSADDGRRFLLRTVPERSTGGLVTGVGLTFVDVTALVAAEEATREARERLSVIVDSIADGFYVLDRNWRFTHVNDQALRHFGKAREELLGQKLLDAFPALAGGAAEERLRLAMDTGEVLHFEVASTVADLILETHVYPGPGGLTVLFRDGTERHRLSKALEESHRRAVSLARFPEENPSPVVRVSAGGVVSYGNPASASLPGWLCKAGEPLPEALRVLVEQAMVTGREVQGEVELGGRFYAISASSPVADGSANVYGRDITERREAEGVLRTALQRFYDVLSSMYSAALLVTNDGRVEFANRAFAERFELEEAPADLVGLSSGELIEKIKGTYLDPDKAIARIRDILDRGQPVTGEEVAMRNGGTCLRDFVPLTVDGVSCGRLWIHTDITARKRDEEALRDADRRKDDFLAVLAHELRNPLTPILNSLSILDRATPNSEQARRAHSVIGRQARQLAHIVDDLLDVARIKLGRVSLRRTRVDLVDVVRRTVEDYRSILEPRAVAIDLPSEPMWIDGDPTRLAQVVGNLLHNAAKFTREDDGTVSVSLTRMPGHAVMEIADTGAGIDSGTLSRLFEPFAQADSSLDRTHGGLGLGLALVKGMVDLHGGEVSAGSTGPGRGARFSVRLPLEAERANESNALPAARPVARPKRVLVIEDNKDAADSLQEALQLAGHEAVVAYNGHTGLLKAREYRPEIVICDIGLPEMNGYDVARAIRADSALKGVSLIALTGYAGPEDRKRAREAGFDRHIAKPPSLEELELVLADVSPGGAAR
jgi:two-component system, chemotaxis family, CheB/CheR fusion protein